MNIIDFSPIQLEDYSKINEYAKNKYQSEEFITYTCVSDDNIPFCITKLNNIYIYFKDVNNPIEFITIEANGEVDKLRKGNYTYNFQVHNNNIFFKNNKMLQFSDENTTYSITILPNDIADSLYIYRINFVQYNREKDIKCIINFDYTYAKEIYESLSRRISSITIAKKASKREYHGHFGIIPPRISSYIRSDISSDRHDYVLISMKENGIIDTFTIGPESLFQENTITRFSRLFFNYGESEGELPWPFRQYYTEKEIYEYIESLGFKIYIPREFIKAYNGEDEDIELIKQFASLMSKNQNKSRKREQKKLV